MDRSNWFWEQLVTHGEMTQAFDDVERMEQDRTIDDDLWGVWNGLVVTENGVPDLKVLVSAGVAFDELGRRIVLDTQGTVDLTSYVPAVGGEQIKVHIYGQNDDVDSDPRVDGGGVPLDYRSTESAALVVVAGAPVAPPAAAPAIVADQVLLAEVVIDNGDIAILNAAITADWTTTPETRQEGGVAVKHGRRNTDDVYFDDLASITFDNPAVTPANCIVMNENNIVLATKVEANERDVAGDQGFLYVDPATGTKIDVDTYWGADAAHMLPGPQAGEAHDQTPILNSWYMDGSVIGSLTVAGNPFWRQDFTAPDTENRSALLVPIVGIPHLAKLIVATVFYGVIGAGMHANHYLRLYLLRRLLSGADTVDVIGADPPANERNAGVGDYFWTESFTAGATQIVDNNTRAYWLAIVNHSAGGATPAEDTIKIKAAKIRYQIREASGAY